MNRTDNKAASGWHVTPVVGVDILTEHVGQLVPIERASWSLEGQNTSGGMGLSWTIQSSTHQGGLTIQQHERATTREMQLSSPASLSMYCSNLQTLKASNHFSSPPRTKTKKRPLLPCFFRSNSFFLCTSVRLWSMFTLVWGFCDLVVVSSETGDVYPTKEHEWFSSLPPPWMSSLFASVVIATNLIEQSMLC